MTPFALCRHLFTAMGHLIGQIERRPPQLRPAVNRAAMETFSAAKAERNS